MNWMCTSLLNQLLEKKNSAAFCRSEDNQKHQQATLDQLSEQILTFIRKGERTKNTGPHVEQFDRIVLSLSDYGDQRASLLSNVHESFRPRPLPKDVLKEKQVKWSRKDSERRSHLKKLRAEDSAAETEIDSEGSAVNAGRTRQLVPVVTNQNQELSLLMACNENTEQPPTDNNNLQSSKELRLRILEIQMLPV